MRKRAHRLKLSTTVNPETHGYLKRLVRTGRAATVAEAIDQVVLRARRAEERDRLERDTAAYLQALSAPAAKEESRLESALAQMVDEIELDG
jgi:hypothetical protein